MCSLTSSHLLCLMQLKEELGNKKMGKLEPPSRNRLVGVNKRPDLVEKRRRELESWLWKLIADGEIARSRVLNNFLELSDAARLVQRCVSALQVAYPYGAVLYRCGLPLSPRPAHMRHLQLGSPANSCRLICLQRYEHAPKALGSSSMQMHLGCLVVTLDHSIHISCPCNPPGVDRIVSGSGHQQGDFS